MKQNLILKNIKVVILSRTIDAGIETYIKNILHLKKIFPKNSLTIKTLVLKKSPFSSINNTNITFYQDEKYPLEKNTVNPIHIYHFILEILWFRRIVSDYKPHIVISIDTGCNLITQTIKMLSFPQMKTVITFHIDVAKTMKRKSLLLQSMVKYLGKKLFTKADIVICPSKGLSNNVAKYFQFNKKPTTIYNGIDINFMRSNILSKRKNNRIIMTARFSHDKDHFTLVQAFKLVLDKIPTSKLWLIGDGPKKKEMEKLVKLLDIEKQVIFFGWKKQVMGYIKKSDIFVLSSKIEGFSYSLLEAMSQGKPVIATKTAWGPSEILDNNNYGILVQEGNPKALKEAIIDLLTDKNKYEYYSKKALERTTFFSLDKMLKKYKNVILRGISQK